jgi:hypothetical protein
LIEIGSSSSSSVRGWRVADERLELGVHQQHPRVRVIQDRAHLHGAQPRVDRDKDATGGRHPEVRLEQRRGVRR